jgi:hypothetical protein
VTGIICDSCLFLLVIAKALHLSIRWLACLCRHSSTVAKVTGQATKQLGPSRKGLVVNLANHVRRDPRMVLDVRSERRAQQRWKFPRVRASASLPLGTGLLQDLIDGVQEQRRRRTSCASHATAQVLSGMPLAAATMTSLHCAHCEASLNSIDDRVVRRWTDQHAARRHFHNQVAEHADRSTIRNRHEIVEHLAQRAMKTLRKLVRKALVRNGGFTADF